MNGRNIEWELLPDPGTTSQYSWDKVHASILMDIRAELRSINRTLLCYETQSIPRTLRSISSKLTKPRKHHRLAKRRARR